MAWKTGVLDRIQRLFSCGSCTRSLPSVGLSPPCQPSDIEPSRRASSLKVEVWSLGSLPLEVKVLKATRFHPKTCTSGSRVRRVRTQSASLDTALCDPAPLAEGRLHPRVLGLEPMGVGRYGWRRSARPEEGASSAHCARAQDGGDPTSPPPPRNCNAEKAPTGSINEELH